jgi:hypothetical protein
VRKAESGRILQGSLSFPFTVNLERRQDVEDILLHPLEERGIDSIQTLFPFLARGLPLNHAVSPFSPYS